MQLVHFSFAPTLYNSRCRTLNRPRLFCCLVKVLVRLSCRLSQRGSMFCRCRRVSRLELRTPVRSIGSFSSTTWLLCSPRRLRWGRFVARFVPFIHFLYELIYYLFIYLLYGLYTRVRSFTKVKNRKCGRWIASLVTGAGFLFFVVVSFEVSVVKALMVKPGHATNFALLQCHKLMITETLRNLRI